ncbi:hypothetical protein ACS96_26125 [Pseudomonas aeruginosa]|nr:hypothetical protein ACS96_26125 [Pseudomonas aeruginosa]
MVGNPALAELLRAPRLIPWRNWSGAQSCLPLAREAPKDLDELVRVIRQASGRIRPVGSGHSFSALVPTDGTLLSLAYFSGLLSPRCNGRERSVRSPPWWETPRWRSCSAHRA